ncbi:MAG: hypothetical protein V1867_00345 [Candidatus Falkowbacteria bacterium]
MTEQQISVLVARLVEHQSAFRSLPTDDAQWVIQNTKQAIAVCVEAIKNRPKPFESILETVGRLMIAPSPNSFVARHNFIVTYQSEDFKREFFSKIEEPFGGSELRYGRLREPSKSFQIIDELGGEDKAETTLTELWGALKKQPDGKQSGPLVNGCANIFFIRNSLGVMRAVGAYWNGNSWVYYARPLDHGFWVENALVFSRHLLLNPLNL